MRMTTSWRVAAAAAVALVLIAACGDDEADPVAAAERRVSAAQGDVTDAQAAYDEARAKFCDDSKEYIAAVDRYGKVFSDGATTVGDVTSAGADLVKPREKVEATAATVTDAGGELTQAKQDLADAEAALAAAQSGTSAPSSTTTSTAPLVPTASVDRVKQAEADLSAATEGITDSTPLTQATVQLNAAAFAVEAAWLRLFDDAGCLTGDQQQQAVNAVADYTTAVQTGLRTAGYYDGPVDGIYGPSTVDAVEQLQTEVGLPVTGLVDAATAAALEAAVLGVGGQVATQALAHTAAVQSTLKLAGYWTGPVDGQWTPELTEALKAFQTALGVAPTGAVDPATLSALQQAIADAQSSATTTSTTEADDTTSTTAASTSTST